MRSTEEPEVRDETDVRFLYAGIFCVSMAVLLLQISLTRIFSFTLWYHFAYVTISVALLGYGASGSFLAVLPGLAGTSPARRLPLYALCCAFSIVIGLLIFAVVPFHPFEMMTLLLTGKRHEIPLVQIPYLFIFYFAVALPFFFAGLCISVALRARSRDVSRLYFFDLFGAGFGCLIVVFVISWVQTPGAVVVSSVIVAFAAVMFARSERHTSVAAMGTGVVVVALLGLAVLRVADFSPSPEKFLYRFLHDVKDTVHFSTRWSAIFRTDSFGFKDEDKSRVGSYAGWGSSPAYKAKAATEAPKLRLITHDGDAGAVIYNFDGDLSKLDLFDNVILKTPYLIVDKPNVLVIGVGGGTDIVNAVKNHCTHVTGVELDPETVRIVKVDQADFAGHLYDRPDVTIIAGEGRSTLRHSQAKYDLIQLTGVDTLAALSTGAYVLSESYLYTTEAMREFVDHLTPDGLLSIIVADFGGLNGWTNGFPRHTIRQLSLFMDTLEHMGIDDPASHIAVITSPEAVPQVSMLLKPKAFTAEESDRLQAFADKMGFNVWALPGKKLPTLHSVYLNTPPAERAKFLSQFPLILTPTSDDNPFFFNFYQWRNLGKSHGEVDVGHTLATGQIIMGFILVLSVVFSVALILMPLVVFQRQGLQTEGKLGFITFFLAIGLGFIFIEISFIQKFVLFLGYPTYSLTVVLFSLLTYSGIGSWLTGRMKRPPEQRFVPLFVALAVVSLLYLFVLPSVFDTFLGSAFPVRVIVAALVLIPLGLVMGMFFPSGILVVRRANEQFVPWAWAINGCASVVATVLAVILAMGNGFRFVSFVALLTYLVGVLGILSTIRRLDATAEPRS
jgi:SAM-dependent methyltransferase